MKPGSGPDGAPYGDRGLLARYRVGWPQGPLESVAVSPKRIALLCAAVAVIVSGGAALASISIRDGRLSALVRMSAQEPMAALAREADPSFSLVDVQAHYDGVYFYTIARDPLARGRGHELIDKAAYRYGHAGYGWLAWLASAGRPRAVPAALFGLSLAGLVVGAFALSLLARDLGLSPWLGLVVALNPGMVFATTADTSEPVAMAALALALLAWTRERYGWAAVALTAGCFIKEPLLLVPVGLGLWMIVEVLRGRAPLRWTRVAALAIGPLLYGGWFLYLRNVFGVWPSRQPSDEFLTAPFTGWIDSLRRAAGLATGPFESMQIGNTSVALLIVIGAVLLAGMILAIRVRNAIAPVFFLLALLVFCLNWLGVLYPKDLIREVALALALVPFLLGTANRRSLEEQVFQEPPQNP